MFELVDFSSFQNSGRDCHGQRKLKEEEKVTSSRPQLILPPAGKNSVRVFRRKKYFANTFFAREQLKTDLVICDLSGVE